MTHQHYTLRPAMTAIAAVIALTATPSIAQSVETTPPIVDMMPTPTTAPDPLAAEPVVTTATTDPVVSETVAPAAAPATRVKTTSASTRATATRSRTVASTTSARPAAAAPAAAIAAAPVAALPEPIAPEAAVPLAPAPMVSPAPGALSDGVTIDDALPIAGAAGLGLIALFGAGMAMRRRRRDDEEFAESEVDYARAEPEAMIEPEPTPTFVRTPEPMAVSASTATTATTKLPAGFDVSRFGPNVQAAYRGPTPDNPSVSLKRRLTVAHFLDKKAAQAAPVAATETAATPAANPAWATRNDGDFMFRRDDNKANIKRAFQN